MTPIVASTGNASELLEQLQFQSTILANIRDSVIVTDLTGRIVYWNEGACALFGYARDEMLGKTPSLLYADLDERQLALDLQDILCGRDYVGEWKGRRKDGALIWVAIKTTLLRNAAAEVVGFIGVASDITSRKQAQEQLATSEERFRALLEKSADAVALLDRAGRRLYASPASARILGYEPTDHVGEEPFGYIHPDDSTHVQHVLAALVEQSGASLSTQFRVRHRDGSWVWIEGTATNLLDHPSVQALVVNYRDISERKRASAHSEYLAQLTEQVSDALISIDRDFVIHSWNRGAETTYGWKAQEAIGRSLLDIAPVLRFVTGSQQAYEQAMAREGYWRGEVIQAHRDGTSLLIQGTASVLKDQHGTVIGSVAVNRDITEHRRLEEQVRASEGRFRALIEHGSDVILLTSAEGEKRYVSPSVTRVLGYTPEEFLSQESTGEAHPDEADFVRERYRHLLAHPGKSIREHLRLRHKDGGYRWVESVASNFLHEPSVQAVVSNFRDISGQKEAQETRARLAAIVESSEDAVIGETLTGVITNWNEAAQRLFGYRADEVIGRSFAALMVPEPLQKEEEEILAKLQRGERIQQLETLRRRKDGSLVPVSLSLSPIKDPTGRVSGAAKIARDITERKELDQRKDEFLAIASHEIRTPLTASKGFLQLLERHLSKRQDQQGLTYVNRVGNQMNRLTRLVADFMDISRIRSGGLVYHEELFDLDDLAREMVETLQQGATSHRIQVEGHTRACIQGDRDRIGQVLGNLLTNAVRYSPAADAVIVRLAADGQSARVSVQDFGPGIAEEEQQQIFERYYRASGAVGRAPAGLGIGLYLAREIISHHHGSIWVESARGEGSIFHFSLPIARQ